MNRKAILGVLVLAALAGLVVLERRGATARITPRPLLTLVADTQRELERLPLELTRVTVDEENEIGQQLARQYGYTFRQPAEGEAKAIAVVIQRVGDRVAANVKRKGIRYRFHYLDESSCVNAWAMPGGQIVFGRGLLELVETEDELAAILAHEIAHVDERHAIERLQLELRSRKMGLGGIYALGRPAIALFEAGYTKEKEAEADRAGLALTVVAGYSPAGAVSVMRRFERFQGMSRQPSSAIDELLGVPLSALQEYFRTHPQPRDRIATLESEIAAKGWDASKAQRPLKLRAIFLAEAAADLDRRGLFDRAMVRYREALALDPDHMRARVGLADAAWRAGETAATVAAAEDVVRREPNAARMWRLLAQALFVAEGPRAFARYDALYRELAQPPEAKLRADTILAVQIDRLGLEIAGGKRDAATDFWKSAEGRLNARSEMLARTRLAWWMYRAGQFADARNELDLGQQRFPGESDPRCLLVWVLSDLGRQSDAQAAHCQGEGAEDLAQKAVIGWRIDQREGGRNFFQSAAAADPAWMVPAWTANNFSAPTAAVLAELQKAELARREKAQQTRGGRLAPAAPRKTP